MIGALQKILVRSPLEEENHIKDWKKWGYLRKPNIKLAREEHANFVETIKAEGVRVTLVDDVHKERLDAIFTSDPAIITDRGAVILKMSKALRTGEEETLSENIEKLNIPILGRIQGEATLEGGDVLWLDPKTIIIGRSYRSNTQGITQLKNILNDLANISHVDLPHWHGPAECLHLLSLISLIDEDLALVYPELAPVSLLERLKARNIKIVEVPGKEFETQGCNVLTLKPRKCLMVEGNPKTRRALEKEGVEIIEFQGQEICLNRTGGPTCLVCSILREY
ncbi:MAG: dimethylarginine dimethylaminohydrolase family protein [Candidatus Freyarchaeota archaeon]